MGEVRHRRTRVGPNTSKGLQRGQLEYEALSIKCNEPAGVSCKPASVPIFCDGGTAPTHGTPDFGGNRCIGVPVGGEVEGKVFEWP
jgi:hypothetical protein